MADASALPKFIQLSEMLIREIAAGRLADGTRLPPERQMADELGVAVGTLRKALADVAEKGLLERVQGSGNYVRQRAPVQSVYAFFRLELLQGGGLPRARVLSVERLRKPARFADLGGDPQAHRIRRLRSLDGMLVALEEIWLDAGLCPALSIGDLSESLYLYYRETLAIEIATAEDQIGVAPLPDWTPDSFHLAAGSAVGHITRFSRTAAKTPVEYSRTWFDPARATYISRMGNG